MQIGRLPTLLVLRTGAEGDDEGGIRRENADGHEGVKERAEQEREDRFEIVMQMGWERGVPTWIKLIINR